MAQVLQVYDLRLAETQVKLEYPSIGSIRAGAHRHIVDEIDAVGSTHLIAEERWTTVMDGARHLQQG